MSAEKTQRRWSKTSQRWKKKKVTSYTLNGSKETHWMLICRTRNLHSMSSAMTQLSSTPMKHPGRISGTIYRSVGTRQMRPCSRQMVGHPSLSAVSLSTWPKPKVRFRSRRSVVPVSSTSRIVTYRCRRLKACSCVWPAMSTGRTDN